MKRHNIVPRNNWQQAVEKLGFGFHTANVPYWDESACYEFPMDEILRIEKASGELWGLCLHAVQHVMDNNLYHRFELRVMSHYFTTELPNGGTNQQRNIQVSAGVNWHFGN